MALTLTTLPYLSSFHIVGEPPTDAQATPIYRQHMLELLALLTRHGSGKSLYRKLALLLTFLAVGRASEVTFSNLNIHTHLTLP